MAMTQQEQAQIVSKAHDLEKRQKIELDKLNQIQSDGFKNPPTPPMRFTAPAVKYPEPVPRIKFDWAAFLITLFIITPVVFALPGLPAVLSSGSGVGTAIGGILYLVVFALVIVGPILAVKFAKSHKFSVTLCGYFTITWLGYIVFYFVMKPYLKEENRNSQEYKQLCASIDEEHNQKQMELDSKYQSELDEYNNVAMPQYEKEKVEWEEKHNRDLSEQTKAYDQISKELETFYSSTRIIPQQYHNIPSLEYLDSIMSSSEYEIAAAIDSYEKKLARDLEMQRIREQQIANEKADEQNQLLYQQNAQLQMQNDLQAESNSIADRARRDQNAAAIVNAVQNHNRNKYLRGR